VDYIGRTARSATNCDEDSSTSSRPNAAFSVDSSQRNNSQNQPEVLLTAHFNTAIGAHAAGGVMSRCHIP